MQKVRIIAAASAHVCECMYLCHIIICLLPFLTTPRTSARGSYEIHRGN